MNGAEAIAYMEGLGVTFSDAWAAAFKAKHGTKQTLPECVITWTSALEYSIFTPDPAPLFGKLTKAELSELFCTVSRGFVHANRLGRHMESEFKTYVHDWSLADELGSLADELYELSN